MQDASDEFNAIHSAKAKGMLKDYLIGRVGESAAKEAKLPLIKELEVRLSFAPLALNSWYATDHHACNIKI